MDKEQIIEIIQRELDISDSCACEVIADEILALHRDSDPMYAYYKESHRPNCIASVYGRTEDPAKCICHSWQRTGDEPI